MLNLFFGFLQMFPKSCLAGHLELGSGSIFCSRTVQMKEGDVPFIIISLLQDICKFYNE